METFEIFSWPGGDAFFDFVRRQGAVFILLESLKVSSEYFMGGKMMKRNVMCPNRTWICFVAGVLSFLALTVSAMGAAVLDSWPQKQRDMYHAGRADFTVPEDRMNDSFFDVFLWQTPSPGSPGEGNFSSTSMVFFDAAGPEGADIVVGGYHWPKGVQGMDRHTGERFWYGNPRGGESIGRFSPAFSPDGSVVYVVNDATQSAEFPDGHPLMAFSTEGGPFDYWHNGNNDYPDHLAGFSPTIAPDGRIFLHGWVDRPYAGTDWGDSIEETWAAETGADCGQSDTSLYDDEGFLMVVIGARNGAVIAYDGDVGDELWRVSFGAMIDAPVTIDPDNGNIYVSAGADSIYVVGLDKDGASLWPQTAPRVYEYVSGVNNRQRAQAAGCLSHDGSTYYFQTNSSEGDGVLYAVNTADGTVKWTYPTQSKGWEITSSSPIVTANDVVIIGNNENGTYYAIHDTGLAGQLLDTLTVESGGSARASATLAGDGKMYLPLRTKWVVGNGSGDEPSFNEANVFSCFDLNKGAAMELPAPGGQGVTPLNNAVKVIWTPIPDEFVAQFSHYAVYRLNASFDSVEGMTPIGTVADIHTGEYSDITALNGQTCYYAVTTVSTGGSERKTIASVGPVTPYDETDLQVVNISRTPRYPRYAPIYTYYEITEPSGFGPYIFSAATGLGNGQTSETPRWPDIGDPLTYTATIRNRGTNAIDVSAMITWRLDGDIADQATQPVSIEPGQSTTFTYTLNWDGLSHDIQFALDITDAREENNSLAINTKSVPFLTYIDYSFYQRYRLNTPTYPDAQTDDLIDWLNRHVARFNQMFADAGCEKRVHYDVLEILPDGSPDPDIDRQPFAIFPFRYRVTDGEPRLSGYYNPTDDIDYGLLHEMAHQLGLIDIYQLDVPADVNEVSGMGYSAVPCLMHGCSSFLSQHSAMAMNHWLDDVHGYYGQYMYNMPSQIKLRILDCNGQPLSGATVKMYQYCEVPGVGKIIPNQIKAQGTTDASGEFTLPNVPIDPSKVPPIYTGDVLNDNPFGYLAVVGTNGVLHFRVEYNGGIDYCWLDITEANVAYFTGQTDVAIFDRQLGIGGPIQYRPPADMTELNADDWSAWAEGSGPEETFVADDSARKIVGSASLKFVTDGGFDTYVRYPRTYTAMWDLRRSETLSVSFYAENPNLGFQSGSPWFRLRDAEGNYIQYQYYQNGYPSEILNEARNQWRNWNIPLDASETENNGWRKTIAGTPDMKKIQFLEIHADTWDNGFTLWIDGVSFLPRPQIPGDANEDGMVNVGDLGILAGNYGSTFDPSIDAWSKGDFNGDGAVNVGDLGILAGNYGYGTSGVSFKNDYAKAFDQTVTNAVSDQAENSSPSVGCASLGLPLIAGLLLAGLFLSGSKLKDE
jgi:outer membrane protein assembly factor BamB